MHIHMRNISLERKKLEGKSKSQSLSQKFSYAFFRNRQPKNSVALTMLDIMDVTIYC